MKKIAIIPARGGSKRIPKKNIKDFMGSPVISYAIKAALQSNLFDTVMVSTDCKEIGKTAKKYGAKVPFFRTKKNSDDFASTDDVIKEVLDYYYDKEEKFDYGCCIYPVNPFLEATRLFEGLQKIKSSNFDCVFSAVKYSYPIQRAFRIVDNKMKMISPKNYLVRSQDLKETYHDAGQFYWFKTKSFIQHNRLWTDNTSIVELGVDEVQDIDTESDWKIAELKFQIKKNLKLNKL